MNSKKIIMNRIVLYFTLIAVSLLVLYLSIIGGLNYTGYCLDEGRRLSTEELNNIAIDFVLAFYPSEVELDLGLKDEKSVVIKKTITYQSMKEFFEMNRGCCELRNVGKRGNSIDARLKIFGALRGIVRVKYLIRYHEENNTIGSVSSEAFVPVSNCGLVWSGI